MKNNNSTIQARHTKDLQQRIKRALRALTTFSRSATLVLSCGVKKQRSRDSCYPFEQDNDFFYLTGAARAEQWNFVLSPALPRPVLVAPHVSEHQILWEGAPEDPKQCARRIGAELVVSDKPIKTLQELTASATHLFLPNHEKSDGLRLAESYLALPSHLRRGTHTPLIGHTDRILEELRLLKSPFEVFCIREAVQIAGNALSSILHLIRPGVSEQEIALNLRHSIEAQQSSESFPAIVAAGENAAVLHHKPSKRKLRSGELLTIDFGASFLGYASDVTRVLPVGAPIPKKLLDLHALLKETQETIVSRIAPGKSWGELHRQTEELLTKGLVTLGLLKGSPQKFKKEQAIKRFFPHSLGHSLGLSTHDIGPLRAQGEVRLAPGMVVTVEPGLYSMRAVGGVPPFGMRIEDDVLVTVNGSKNLTEMIEKFTS